MSQTKEDLRWALIGASDIARTRMINAINSQPDSRVAAIFSSNADRANAYAAQNKIPKPYDNLNALLNFPGADRRYFLDRSYVILSCHLGSPNPHSSPKK
jgi:hypothetical protein